MESGAFPLSNYKPADGLSPGLIAHRAGITERELHAAQTAGVDWLEVDVWWHHGRLVVRHDPALWRLPVTYNRWRMSVALRPFPTLDQLLDAVAGLPVRLLLDLKGTMPEDSLGDTLARTPLRRLLDLERTNSELPRMLVATLRQRGALTRAALCAQGWAALDVARALEPTLPVFFSLGREEHVSPYLERLEGSMAPRLISVNHRLLTSKRVADLRRHGVTMIAWTVNDLSRARDLVAWGVDGITSDSLELLHRLRTERLERAA